MLFCQGNGGNMFRFDIINGLIKKHGFKKYLEIGVRNPDECFNLIECETKHSVDPLVEHYDERIDYKFTSDDFFSLLENGQLDLPSVYKWDLVFIDGLHISNWVERDILNSLNHLSEDGYVVLHDCNPPDIFRAREDYVVNGEVYAWNGTVWKAIYKMRATRPDLLVCTVDTDEGVGIIKRGNTGQQVCCDFNNPYYEYRIFEQNRKDHLNLISVEDFVSTLLDR